MVIVAHRGQCVARYLLFFHTCDRSTLLQGMQQGRIWTPRSVLLLGHCNAIILRAGIWADEHNGLVAAFAGVAVAAFTGVLWGSTEKLWRSNERQITLARQEFIATHRPEIIMREAYMEHRGDDAYVCYYITNRGRSAGRIVESRIMVEHHINTGLVLMPCRRRITM